MADTKLTDLTGLSTPASGDKFYIVDISDLTDGADGTSKHITLANITTYVASLTEILTNKTIDGDDNTVQDLPYSSIKSTSRTGSDTKLVTGTAGTTNFTAKWNADGDLVDGYELKDEDTMASDSATSLATQ